MPTCDPAPLQGRTQPRLVTRKPDRPSFADIVREVREQPAAEELRQPGVVDPTGTRWRPTQRSISAGQAHALAEKGAHVAWDPCGCGGYCGFTWFSSDDTTRLVAAGTPTVRNTKRHRGNISEWQSDDGRVLVVAEDAVRWSDLLA